MNEITLVNDLSGDWQGVYVNGKIKLQGGSVDLYDILSLLGELHIVEFDSFNTDMYDENIDFLPNNLTDVSPEEEE